MMENIGDFVLQAAAKASSTEESTTAKALKETAKTMGALASKAAGTYLNERAKEAGKHAR